MAWISALLALITLFLFFGGTVLILMTARASWKTRIRWAAVSIAPPLFMFLILAVFTPKDSSGESMEWASPEFPDTTLSFL